MRSHWIQRLVQALIAVGVLAYLAWDLHTSRYSLATLRTALLGPQGWAVWLAVALLPANQLLEAAKWRLLVGHYYPRLGWGKALVAVLRGAALGFVTPNRLGDYLGRVFSLPEHHQWEAASLTLFSRLAQLMATVVGGLVALFLTAQQVPPAWRRTFLLLGVTLLAAGVSLVLLLRLLLVRKPRLRHALGKRGRQYLRRMMVALSEVPAPVRWRVLALAGLRYGIFSAQYVLLFYATGFAGRVAEAFALVGNIFLIKSVAPTVVLAELGIRGMIARNVARALYTSDEVAFHATLLLYLLNLVLPALIGFFLLGGLRIPRFTFGWKRS